MLSAFVAERPADDDAPLARAGYAAHVRGEPAEDDRSATGNAGRVRAGAVEGRPHELRSREVGGRNPLPGEGEGLPADVDPRQALERVVCGRPGEESMQV